MGSFGKAPEEVTATAATSAMSLATMAAGSASASASNPAVATTTIPPMFHKTGNPGVNTGSSPLSMASVINLPKTSGPPLSSLDKSMASIKAKMEEMKLAQSGSSANNRTGASTSSTPVDSRSTQNRAQSDRKNPKNDKGKGKAEEKEAPNEFGDLPAEVRVKIWRMAMDVPRIIEIEKGPVIRNGLTLATNYPICGDHGLHRVAPRSRQPPVFFSINYECREQALKIYEKRSFDTQEGSHDIYFNPRADILYFGEKTCVTTLLHVFMGAVYEGLTISRVAILSSGNRTNCCDWDEPAYGVDGGVTIMQSLHGFHKSIVSWQGKPRWPGCPSLERVYWVTPSHLWEPAPGRVDPDFQSFRAPSTDGITKGQINFKDRILRDIERVDNDLVLGNVGQNFWVGESKPTFEFVSLAPPDMAKTLETEERVHEAFEITIPQHKYLGRRNFAALIDIERRTGCDVLLSRFDFPGEGREVGLVGDKKAVAKARKAVEDKLAKMENAERRF